MNLYELMLIFDPKLGEEVVGKILSKTEEKIKSFAGEIEKIDKWGIRRLASVFNKNRKITQGVYIVVYFKSETSVPEKLSAYLKVTENVLRYSIIKSEPETLQEIKGEPVPEQNEIKQPEATPAAQPQVPAAQAAEQQVGESK